MAELSAIAKRLIHIREDQGLSSHGFAKEIGIGPKTIWDLEHGVSKPTVRIINAVCSRFRANPTWISFEIGNMYLKDGEVDPLSEFFASIPGASKELWNLIASMPFQEVIALTVNIDNFFTRHGELYGLTKLTEFFDWVKKSGYEMTAAELNEIAETIKSRLHLYKNADPSLFADLIRAYHLSKIDELDQKLRQIKPEESKAK